MPRRKPLRVQALAVFSWLLQQSRCSLRPEPPDEGLDVFIAQPNIDVYGKHGGLTQEEQNEKLLSLMEKAPADSSFLFIAPETFTSDVIMNDISSEPYCPSLERFTVLRQASSGLLFGASTWEYLPGKARPSQTARQLNNGIGWSPTTLPLMMEAAPEKQGPITRTNLWWELR